MWRSYATTYSVRKPASKWQIYDSDVTVPCDTRLHQIDGSMCELHHLWGPIIHYRRSREKIQSLLSLAGGFQQP